MKPIIQKLWVVIAVLCASLTASAYDFEVDGIAYTITSFTDLTCTVATSDKPYEGEINVPSNVVFKGKTLTVTSISNGAFKNSHVTSVQLPETIAEIEANAFFGCENLKSVGFKEGLRIIGDNAFKGCVSLSDIILPNSLKTIGSSGFANCKSLSKVSLITDMTELEDRVFYGCNNLQEIRFGKYINNIKDYAFAYCGFTSFVIPNTVAVIGERILLGNQGNRIKIWP